MSRVTEESGFTLVELMMAAAIMIVVLFATLSAFDSLAKSSAKNQRVTELVDNSRQVASRLARDIRNATAYQTTANQSSSGALVRAGSFDLVFKAVDPFGAPSVGNSYAVTTTRYCYNTTTRIIYRQTKADIATPSATCPDATWSGGAINQRVNNGASRPLFSYNDPTPSAVSAITLRLWSGTNVAGQPEEIPLTTTLFLRNQNRPPTANIAAVATSNRHVQLNGSYSTDPEGRRLSFAWQDNGVPIPDTSPFLDYTAPTTGSRVFTLTVTDDGGLTHTVTRTVTVL